MSGAEITGRGIAEGASGAGQENSNFWGMMLVVTFERPSVSAWLTAWRSMLRFAARRTRRSAHGDFGSHCSVKTYQMGSGR